MRSLKQFLKFTTVLAFLPLLSCSTQITSTGIPIHQGLQQDEFDGYDPRAGYYFLSKSLVAFDVKRFNDKFFVDTPTIKKIPDSSYLLQPRFDLSPGSDDDFKITTSTEGFLSKITNTSDDKTADIIKTVASFIITLFTGVPTTYTPERLFDGQAEIVFRGSFDPTDAGDIERINRNIAQYALTISIQPIGWDNQSFHSADSSRSSSITTTSANSGLPTPLPEGGANPFCVPDYNWMSERVTETGVGTEYVGVLYRPALPYMMSVCNQDIAQSQFVLNIENRSPIMTLDLRRTGFVKRINTVTFTEGVPTEFQVQKPSEALAIVSLPLTILDSALTSISKIIPFAGANFAAENKLLTEQKAYYENLLALERAKEALKNAGNGEEAPTPRTGTGQALTNTRSPTPDEGDQADFGS